MPIYRAGGRTIRADRALSDAELEEAFGTTAPEEKSGGILPTALRIAGPVIGGTLGLVTPLPGATAVGSAIGGAIGDAGAQALEINRGVREEYNPLVTAANAALAPIAPGGATVVGAAARAAAFGAASTTVMSLAEKRELPAAGELALGTLTGAVLGGAFKGATSLYAWRKGRAAAMKASLGEVIGDDAAASIPDVEYEQLSFPGIKKTEAKLTPGPEQVIQEELFPNPRRVEKQFRGIGGRFVRPTSLAVQQELPLPTQGTFDFAAAKPPQPLEFKARGAPPPEPESPIAAVQPSGKVRRRTALFSKLRPRYSLFARIEEQTGVPVYTDVYSKVESGNVSHLEYLNGRAEDLKFIFRGVSNKDRATLTAWLEAPDKAFVERSYGMSPMLRSKAQALGAYYEKTFADFGLDPKAFWEEYVPAIRRAGGDVDKAFPVQAPPEVRAFRRLLDLETSDPEIGLRGIMVEPTDRDSLGLALRFTRAGSYNKHLADVVDEMEKKYVGLDVRKPYDDDIRLPVKAYLNEIKGTPDWLEKKLVGAFVGISEKLSKTPLTHREARELVDMFVGLQYGSTLAFRPGPVVRNAFQGIQTGYALMGNAYWKGVRRAMSEEGQKLVEKYQVTAGEPGPVFDVAAMASSNRAQQAIGRFTKFGLRAYKAVDDFHRASIFLGQYDATLKALQKYKGDPIKVFADRKANLLRFYQPQQTQILEQIAKGNFEDAAALAGRFQADRTQFVYRTGNRPEFLSGTLGKTGFGLTSWGSFYADLLAQMGPSGPGPKEMRARDLIRFGVANAAIVFGIGGINAAAGVSDPFRRVAQWVALGPLSMGPGPGGEAALQAGKAVGELGTGRVGPATRKTLTAPGMFLPGESAGHDIVNLLKKDQGPREALLRYIGLAQRPRVFQR